MTNEIPTDELEMICEREAIAVQDMEPATAQAAYEYRLEKAKEKWQEEQEQIWQMKKRTD